MLAIPGAEASKFVLINGKLIETADCKQLYGTFSSDWQTIMLA